MGKRENRVCYGLGRSRDNAGNIKSLHLNPYVNCLHTQIEAMRSMMILVVEVYGKKKVRRVALDDYNCSLVDDGTIGTITQQSGNIAPRHNYKIVEIYE